MKLIYNRIADYSSYSILAAAVALTALAMLYIWTVTPHLQYLHTAESYKAVAADIEKTTKAINSELYKYSHKLDRFKKKLSTQKELFFDFDSAKDFLENLQSLIDEKQCFANSIKFLPVKQVDVKDANAIDIQQLSVSVNIIGRYENIVALLNSLQKGKKRVWIDTISIRQRDLTADLLECDMTLSIYALKIKQG